jgi:4-amino-4-deoxy-L-arabinose transferase-like glycosyltransferase
LYQSLKICYLSKESDACVFVINSLSSSSRPVRILPTLAATLAVFVVLVCVYLPFTGTLHLFDWDELIFAEAAREMTERRDFLRVFVNYEPFFEKPPGFFWFQALSYQLVGINEWGARLPSVLFTAAAGALLFWLGSYILSPGFGLLWTALFGLGFMPAVLGKLGLVDPTFNFFVLCTLIGLFAADESRRQDRVDHSLPKLPYATIAALSLAIAVLVKGPLALAIVLPTFAIYKFFVSDPSLSPLKVLAFLGSTLLLAGSWFAIESLVYGPEFVTKFVTYQFRITGTSDGHPGFIGFHSLVFLIGCFPFSIFTFRSIFRRSLYRERRFTILALLLFGIVLILFELIVKTKLIHYSSMLYAPGSFLAAQSLWRIWQGKVKVNIFELAALLLVAILLAVPLLILPYAGNHLKILDSFLHDPSARAYLDTPVIWGWETFFPGVFLLLATGLSVFLWVQGKPKPAIATLIATGALSANLSWIFLGSRIDAYVEAPMVRYIAQVGNAPLAFYGPLTYLPPFYAKRAIANPHSPAELEKLVAQQPNLQVVVRASEQSEITQFPSLKVQNRYGAYLLLGPHLKSAERAIATVWQP